MDEAQRQQALHISDLDEALATAGATIADGIFLVAFAATNVIKHKNTAEAERPNEG